MQPNFAQAFAGEEHQSFRLAGKSNRAALLIHGFPGTPAEMRPLATILHQQGYTISAPLLPGFGVEIESLPDHTCNDWLDATRIELLNLKQTHEHILICGNSMGSAIAICHAAKYDVNQLVLFAPFWQLDHFLWKSLPFINIFIKQIKPFQLFSPDFDDPEFRRGITNFMPDIDIDDPAVRENIRNFEVPITMFNQVRKLGKHAYNLADQVTCPVLIIQGSEDELVTPKMTHQLQNRIPGETSYVEIAATHDLLNTAGTAWHIISEKIEQVAQPMQQK